jgi:hypothetical protein
MAGAGPLSALHQNRHSCAICRRVVVRDGVLGVCRVRPRHPVLPAAR